MRQWCHDLTLAIGKTPRQLVDSDGLVVAILYCSLRTLSWPVWKLHDRCVMRFASDLGKRRRFIELWTVGFALALSLCAAASAYGPPQWWWTLPWAVVAMLRVFDILQLLWGLSITKFRPWSVTRSVLLLFVHYGEIILGFACMFLFVQTIDCDAVFKIGEVERRLGFVEVVYFSGITAATIGYGDVVPRSADGPIVALARGLILSEAVLIVVITLVELPRLIAFLTVGPESDTTKRSEG